MINRVLIRIKVVQLLYSYLLTEKVFTLESQPTPPTKEKRFAYGLYLDMLVLLTRIADTVVQRGGVKPLSDNRFIRTVGSDEKVKSLINKLKKEPSPVCTDAIVDRLSERVKESAVYKAYAKLQGSDMAADVKVWREIFNLIVMTDAPLREAIEQLAGFSPSGVERMRGLMEVTFVNFSSSQSYVDDAVKTLRFSLDKARELYFAMLLLAVQLTDLQEQNLDAARHKYVVTDADLNPTMRFGENGFIRALRQDPDLVEAVERLKLSWLPEHHILLSTLLKAITTSQIYLDYMAAPSTDFKADCELWRDLLRRVVFPHPDLAEALEDQCVFWNDDLDIIGTFVLKTVRRFEEGEAQPLLPMYKDYEDSTFGRELFEAVVRNKDQYRDLINEVLNKDSWDADRLAFMDVVIFETALAEIMTFPKVPVSVSVNEYLELAKAYSTPKSAFFINGLLGAAVAKLREEGKLLKP